MVYTKTWYSADGAGPWPLPRVPAPPQNLTYASGPLCFGELYDSGVLLPWPWLITAGVAIVAIAVAACELWRRRRARPRSAPRKGRPRDPSQSPVAEAEGVEVTLDPVWRVST